MAKLIVKDNVLQILDGTAAFGVRSVRSGWYTVSISSSTALRLRYTSTSHVDGPSLRHIISLSAIAWLNRTSVSSR